MIASKQSMTEVDGEDDWSRIGKVIKGCLEWKLLDGKPDVAEREMFESVNTPSVVIHFLMVKTAPSEVSSKISRDAKLSLQRASAITNGNGTCYLLGLSEHK